MPLVRGILLNFNRAPTLFNVKFDENHPALLLTIIIVIRITDYLLNQMHPLVSSAKWPGSVSKYEIITAGVAVHAPCL